MADDALCVSKMNVGPGGKQPNMRDSVIPVSNPFGYGGQVQSLVYPNALPNDHPHKKFEGKPKGMRVVAEERGYLTGPEGKRLVGDCVRCKAQRARKFRVDNNDQKDVDSEESESESEDNRPDTCCLRRLLSMQDDFRAQKCLIQLVRSNLPHVLINFDPR
jgi:hypothetical protein